MKTRVLLTAASVLLASSLLASNASAQSMATSVPPPPGINDPGVKAVAPPAARPARATPSPQGNPMDRKAQALPSMQDAGNGKDASLPQISVRQEGDNTIQEYSHSGQVYMVVVTPRHGIQQTYMVDPQGRLVDEHGQKPVGPAMYKVLEWGKSKPAAAESTEAAPTGGAH